MSEVDRRLQSLNSLNLRQLATSSTEKNSFLRSYIRSQEAHLADYAIEGKSIATSWRDESVPQASGSKPTAAGRDIEMESGFGTPILKHRVRELPLEAAVSSPQVAAAEVSQRRDSGGHVKHKLRKRIQAEAASTKKPRERRIDANVAKDIVMEVGTPPMKGHYVRGHEEKSDKRIKSSGIIKKNNGEKEITRNRMASVKNTGGARTEKATVKKPDQEIDHDEDHRGRLAERRERRRAKQAIVNPKPKPLESMSEEDADEGRRGGNGRKASKKGKKGKGLNMPAGLALMHGFSATNIGKNRLTLDTAVGVFNKGKASAKTTIKNKSTKPHLKLFSEQRFLGRSQEPITDVNTASETGSGRQDIPFPSRNGVSREEALVSVAKSKKRARSSSSSARSSSAATSTPRDDQSLIKKKAKCARQESPPWDIEREDGELGSESDTSVPSGKESNGEGTVVLNIHATNTRWATVQQNGPASVKDVPSRDAEAHSEAGDSVQSFIAPSNSASQAAFHVSSFHPVAHAKSKYFLVASPEPVDLGLEPSTLSPSPPTPSGYRPTRHEEISVRADRVGADFLDGHIVPLVEAPVINSTSALSLLSDDSPDQAFSQPRFASTAAAALESSLSPILSGSPLGLLSGPPSPALSGFLGLLDIAPVEVSVTERYDPETRNQRRRKHPRIYAQDPCVSRHSLNVSVGTAAAMDVDRYDPDTRMPELALVGPALDFLSDTPGPARVGGEPLPSLEGHLWELGDVQEPFVDTCSSYSNPAYILEEYELVPAEYGQEYASHGEGWHNGESHGSSYLVEEASGGFYDDCPLPGFGEAMRGGVNFQELNNDAGDFSNVADERDRFVVSPRGADDDDFGYDPEPGALAESFDDVAMATELALEDNIDGGYESDSDDRSVLGSLQRFSQGRALLMGVPELEARGDDGGRAGASRVEEDVARTLKGHWQRQRF
ncbi:hypothetical protein C2E23DRAFT_95156 [Lenzites betulinus]|nr:hypothetical protein C2E23DRAFT_95156 [Lenzites betulinus]